VCRVDFSTGLSHQTHMWFSNGQNYTLRSHE
jgi:hypothetical protein